MYDDDDLRWRPQEWWDDGDTPEPVTCERCGIGDVKHTREKYGSDADGNRYIWVDYYECTNCDWDGNEEYIRCDECGRGREWCECADECNEAECEEEN